jgi:dihydroxyacid dehydratase/phosphogluconate dehydratase
LRSLVASACHTLDDFDKLGHDLPAGGYPAVEISMEDFYYAGGIPAWCESLPM